MTPPRRPRRGFTLIELLVVISIIGVLVGLLLPAINSAREAGRRTQCANNMHNLALAMHLFHNDHNSLPAAGTYGEDPTTNSTDYTTSVINTWIYTGGTAPTVRGTPMFSWVVDILPYLDQQDLYDQWAKTGTTTSGNTIPVSYSDSGSAQGGTYVVQSGNASNAKIASTSLAILRCPDDTTTQSGEGNLSYVVNGGFTLWHPANYAWQGSATDGSSAASATTTWATNQSALIGVCQKLGVMFLESEYVNPTSGQVTTMPWNAPRTTLSSIFDGTSSTVLLTENTLVGFGSGNSYSSNIPTNWASPQPTFCKFMGSNQVCIKAPLSGTCTTIPTTPGTGLSPNGDVDGALWTAASQVGNYDNIGFGQNLSVEGSFPFVSSGHQSGSNFAFCDGRVQFITNTINGTVYSKILTPGGGKLPLYCRQLPLSQDAIVGQ